MQMDDGIDTGDMLVVKLMDIAFDDTGETLHDKLAKAGADAIRGNHLPIRKRHPWS